MMTCKISLAIRQKNGIEGKQEEYCHKPRLLCQMLILNVDLFNQETAIK